MDKKTEIQWIPVGERLPVPEHEYVEYLVTILYKTFDQGKDVFTSTARFNTFHKLWINTDSETIIEWEDTTVLAWAELPEPYTNKPKQQTQ